MTETGKPSFFHTMEFNVWLITSFFTIFVSVFLVILPVVGVHTLGVAAGEELSRYRTPDARTIRAPKPEPAPAEGIPVAFRSRTGP